MIKLKEVVRQLDNNTYSTIENKLIKTKADNFLYVLRAYRQGVVEDNGIMNELRLATNSFYVLKSRLYERIQNQLISDVSTSKKDIFSQLEQVPFMCYNASREITVAFLHKLETEFMALEMNNELLIIYSALKRIHYNSHKYYEYSQLYNKHIALWLSLEKVEDTLSDFNLLLEQYEFSKSSDLINKMLFLRLEINNYSAVGTSKNFEIVKNIMDLQLYLFCEVNPAELDAYTLLDSTQNIVCHLRESADKNKWECALNFLAFEYYKKSIQTNKANEFYEKNNRTLHNLLLYSNVAIVSKFLTSKIKHLCSQNQQNILVDESIESILCNDNVYSKVQLGIYKAMALYYSNEVKKAITVLNDLLTIFSLRDAFHICMEIKFTLAFMYFKINEMDVSESLIVSIYRKIKADKLTQYAHALDLIKFFNTFYKGRESTTETKRSEALLLFFARNNGEYELLVHLQSELKNNYFKN